MQSDADFKKFVDAHGGEVLLLDNKSVHLCKDGSTISFHDSGFQHAKLAGSNPQADAESVVQFWKLKLRRAEGDLARCEEMANGGGLNTRGRFEWNESFYGVGRPIAPGLAQKALPIVTAVIADCRAKLAEAEARELELCPWRRKLEPAAIWWGQ